MRKSKNAKIKHPPRVFCRFTASLAVLAVFVSRFLDKCQATKSTISEKRPQKKMTSNDEDVEKYIFRVGNICSKILQPVSNKTYIFFKSCVLCLFFFSFIFLTLAGNATNKLVILISLKMAERSEAKSTKRNQNEQPIGHYTRRG